jgi:ATP synthase protein I
LSDGRRNDEDELGRRIAEAKRANGLDASSATVIGGENKGMAVGVEFVGAVLVATFIGWALDKWLGTKPWLMIAMLVLGFATGIYRAMVTSRQIDAAPGKTN